MILAVPGMIKYSGRTVNQFGLDDSQQILYQFNDQGFRGPDFNFIPQYAFFGCSTVFGIGVEVEQTFPYLFNDSQNYGLAGSYSNHDIFSIIKQFIDSDRYHDQINIAVIWTDRGSENLNDYLNELQSHKLIHFFCGTPLLYCNCYSMPPNLDHSVEFSHMGPITHKFIHKILCRLFNQ